MHALGIIAKIALGLGLAGALAGAALYLAFRWGRSSYAGFAMFIPLYTWYGSAAVFALGAVLYGAWRVLR